MLVIDSDWFTYSHISSPCVDWFKTKYGRDNNVEFMTFIDDLLKLDPWYGVVHDRWMAAIIRWALFNSRPKRKKILALFPDWIEPLESDFVGYIGDPRPAIKRIKDYAAGLPVNIDEVREDALIFSLCRYVGRTTT